LNPTGYVDQMRDSDVVASIVSGDPEGLAVAYDRYASDLFGYCRSLLAEPADAADAVQDTFVIAASKLGGLREPDRLRAWLFAVARNECLHRLRSRRAAAPLQDAPEQADESADVARPAERGETIALVRAAADGLNDGERDVIQQLWHGLDVPEVAAVLGVSRNHAHALFSRARQQLAASIGVLLVSRAGRRDCADLDSLLGDWDGRLTARLRKRVGKHIDQCRVCSDRQRRELTPAMLFDLTPGALLSMAALRLGSAGAHLGPLAGVRDAVLHLAGIPAPHAAALHLGQWHAVAGRSMHSFGASGFPKPAATGHLAFLHRPHLPVAPISVVGGTAVAATATMVVTVVAPPYHHRPAPATHGGSPSVSAQLAAGPPAAPGSSPGTLGSGPPAASSPTSRQLTRASPSSAVLGSQGAQVTASATTGRTGAALATPSDSSVNEAQQPTYGQATTPAASATVTAGATAAAAGTLTLSTTTVVLSALGTGTLTLTASGGSVPWSISEPASLLGSVTVSPSSGTLAAGQSVIVSISTSTLLSLDSQLTVDPGGQPVRVVLSLL
jgi:RNA polymerase sigma factor (sigma-70 family)